MGDYIDVVITQPDAGMVGRGNGATAAYGGGGQRRSGGERTDRDRDRFGGGGGRYGGAYGR